MEKLTHKEAEKKLDKLPGWELADDGGSISKTVSLPDFTSALALVNKLGKVAETANHHPTISFSWGTVTVTLSTHEVGGLSEKDFTLAETLETLLH